MKYSEIDKPGLYRARHISSDSYNKQYEHMFGIPHVDIYKYLVIVSGTAPFFREDIFFVAETMHRIDHSDSSLMDFEFISNDISKVNIPEKKDTWYIVVDRDMTMLGGDIHDKIESAAKEAEQKSLQHKDTPFIILSNVGSAINGVSKLR